MVQPDWIERNKPLMAFAGRIYPRFVCDLRALVDIESESGDAEGSGQIARWLQGKLAALSASVETRANTNGVHLIARLPGNGQGRFLFLMHTDTVHPRGSLLKQPFLVDDQGHAYGPGAGDSKSSVVFSLYVAEALQALAGDSFSEMVLYFDCEEEIGSEDEEAIVIELAQNVDVAFVLDTARPDWGIVTRRKGIAGYELRVHGIPGHSGNAPQATASATMELAHQLTALNQLASPSPGDPTQFSHAALVARSIQDHGQFIPEISINAGVIGTRNTKANVVPDQAYAVVEVRAYQQADLERIDQAVYAQTSHPTVSGTRVEVIRGRSLLPMEKSQASARIIELYKQIVRTIYQAEVVEWSAGGITVGNLTSQYIPTVDALAVEVHNEHDLLREYADLNTFAPRLVSLVLLVQELGRGPAI